MVPLPLADEPPVEYGPETMWSYLMGRPLNPGEQVQIHEIARAFNQACDGHAAYWIVRVMGTVAIDDPEKLSLRYVRGVMKRMSRNGEWSSEALVGIEGDERGEGTAAAGDRAARPKGQRLRQEPLPQSPPRRQQLPAELAGSKAVEVYLRHAPPGVTLNEAWAQLIHERVSNLGVWEHLCANWSVKNDYSAVGKMLDRYDNDVRGLGQLSATQRGGEAAPVTPSEADILSAPDISDEDRGRWLQVFRSAPDEQRAGVLHEFWTWWSEAHQARRAAVPAAGGALPLTAIWQMALHQLKAELPAAEFERGLQGSSLRAIDGPEAIIAVPSPRHREALTPQWLRQVRRALEASLGVPVQPRVVVEGDEL